MESVDTAWVLIFNAGKSNEGVYTLQGRSKASSAYVLAFERTDDAERFALQLQGEGFDLATPLCWDARQLEAFCEAGDFEVSLVTEGTLITPPRKNEYDTDAFEKLTVGNGLEKKPVVEEEDAASASSAETTDTEQRRGGSGADDGHKTLDLRQQGGRHFEAERAALERLWQSGQGGQDGGADNDKPWRD